MADNLVLGRGKVLFAPYPFGQTSGGAKAYFGNTPTMALAQTNTKLDHFSSEGGLKVKDRSVILQNDMTITFDVDNINFGNLALWFGGNNTDDEPFDAPGDLGTISIIGKTDSIYGALFFESDNPIGANVNYWFPYVNLTPNGTFALKGDTWQTMSFTAEALKRDNATERVYIYSPPGGASTAASDTTPEFTVSTAGIGADFLATGGTISATTPQVHDVAFPAPYTLTGGTVAYAFLNNGTVMPETFQEVIGTPGTLTFTAPLAATYHAQIYNNAEGTGSPIANSSTIVVS